MSKKKARWRKLDNAAKLYSAASNKKDTRVFRFYCELKEEVNKEENEKNRGFHRDSMSLHLIFDRNISCGTEQRKKLFTPC